MKKIFMMSCLIFILFTNCDKKNPTEPEQQTGTITDQEGNTYNTIKIDNQWWMAENLKVTHYRNGDAIPNVTSDFEWKNLSTGAFCVYENNESHADTYGYLYNWYAVDDSRKIAPAGWHVPTDEEWKQLEIVLGMNRADADVENTDVPRHRGTNEASKMSGNADLWKDGALDSSAVFGESGLSALPGGTRDGYYGGFYNVSFSAGFWSSTADDFYNSLAWDRFLVYSYSDVQRFSRDKRNGYSIRCVKD